jgi:excisionase family DNA binding protein
MCPKPNVTLGQGPLTLMTTRPANVVTDASVVTENKLVIKLLEKVLIEVAALRATLETRTAPHETNLLALGADDLTIRQAAALVGRDPETLRNWCREHGIGTYDTGRGRWIVSRKKLMAYVENRFGIMQGIDP